MSEIKWTEKQKRIIEERGNNILVSAAAGSGKTAVLIERIFQRLTDKEKPVDVDRFVVVTFTNAAAAQMMDRLRERIERALEENPDNTHLQRQIPLLSSAHISTVHSFCGYILKNYFHRIGLDPSYRQGTESELELLRNEVLGDLLEREYTERKEDFVRLAELNAFNVSDRELENMIKEIYNCAMSEPFPQEWLEHMRAFFSLETKEEWCDSGVCTLIMDEFKHEIEGIADELATLLKICEEPDGPYVYVDNVTEVQEKVNALAKAKNYEEVREELRNMKFSNMSSKKDDTIHAEKREQVKNRRNACKDALKALQTDFFYQSPEQNLEDLKKMGDIVLPLLRLTEEFMEAFSEEKRERNLVDFNDLEQLAISVLLKKEESGEYTRSEAALELADFFEEIMIDEYQDSNRVQDTILSSVSRQGLPGRDPNIFMVGDVKQSIYRFRNACPELFAEKLQRYVTEKADHAEGIRIDLHQNFRSRELILEGCNRVFERVMHWDIGGVEYDEAAKLRVGREFPETEKNIAKTIDTYVVLGNKDLEAEGRLTAQIIQEMVNGDEPLMIQDGDTLRRVSYGDIVILARSTKAAGQTYFDMLTEAGIPVVMEHTQGFFDTREIRLMTQMMQVIDNPRDDLALAGVLCSPMFGWSEEELALVRSGIRDKNLYDSLLGCEREEMKGKINNFFVTLERLRKKTSYATVVELIQDIYDITGIYDWIKMMRDGVQRAANMDYLMEQAREFDGTTYHGLHAFVNYIKQIQEQKQDLGEVNIVGENEDAVRIMTMHKSKGLEFPVCFLLNMGKQIKRKGGRDYLTILPDEGIACQIEDRETRTKKQTLYQSVLKHRNDMADLGEELRVLYVAMTRAQEKLIMIGNAKEIASKTTDYLGRKKMNSLLDMVMPAALAEPELFQVIPVWREHLVQSAARDIEDEIFATNVLNNFDTSVLYHKELHERLEELSMEAEMEGEPLPVKVSVSDLKIKSMEEQEFSDFTILTHEEEECEQPVPAFMKEDGEEDSANRGAAYGTIWHQVMATIDFSRTDSEEEIREAVQELIHTGRLRQQEESVLRYGRLYRFFSSALGKQMRQADEQGRLHREQPFVIEKPACELFDDRTEEDAVLVQGIIDGFYETDEGIVLMDYKTDSIQKGEEEVLINRYRTQMELYREALEQMMDRPVIRCVLYSFSLGKEVEIK